MAVGLRIVKLIALLCISDKVQHLGADLGLWASRFRQVWWREREVLDHYSDGPWSLMRRRNVNKGKGRWRSHQFYVMINVKYGGSVIEVELGLLCVIF